MSLKFRNLNNSWVHKDNNPNNKNLLFVKKVFQYLQNGESVWLERNNKIYKHQIQKGKKNYPSLFFRTGGTSGKKKWVEHNEFSIASSVESISKTLNADDISSWCCLPLNHVGGMIQVFRALHTGGKILFNEYRNLLGEIPSKFNENQWISLVPTQLHNLVSSPKGRDNLRGFRGIFVGGAALSENLSNKCQKYNIPVYPTYGMSETAGMISLLDSDSFQRGIRGVGKVLPHAQMTLESLSNRILVKAESMSLNLVKPTQWLKTHDFGHQDNHENWFINGRLDRYIISGGENVDPFMIERILDLYEPVDECLVVGEEDERWGQRIVAYVTPDYVNHEHLIKYARDNLEPRLVPKEWKVVKALPLNQMGKPKV
jgi:O-succinylbenzoic acid--CoA ligase